MESPFNAHNNGKEVKKIGIAKKTVVLALTCLLVFTVTAAALYSDQTVPQQIPTGIILQQHPDAYMQLGVYWDSGCTENVTTIDFGEMVHPNTLTTLSVEMWIRNEGNVSHTVYWNSTLSSNTTEITDEWYWSAPRPPYSPLNGTIFAVGQTRATTYAIHIQEYAETRYYNWTLTIWAEWVY